jgi:hypothetical protein
MSSGLLNRAVWWKFNHISEVLASSIIKANRPDDGLAMSCKIIMLLHSSNSFPSANNFARHVKTPSSVQVTQWH